jgi:hypothetical protein
VYSIWGFGYEEQLYPVQVNMCLGEMKYYLKLTTSFKYCRSYSDANDDTQFLVVLEIEG